MEKQARCTIVLTPTGEYKKVSGTVKEDIGQEVTVRPCLAVPKAVYLAAVLVIAVVISQALPSMLGSNQAYAYVTLDINPSTEFAINADHIVLSAHPYNQEAVEILAGMEYTGKGIAPVLAEFTQSAISQQYIKDDSQNHVIVSFYSEHAKDKQTAEAELGRITETQRQVLKSYGREADMNIVIVDPETRKEARRLGVSAGRLEEAEQEREMEKGFQDEWIPAGNAGESYHPDKDNQNNKEQDQTKGSRKKGSISKTNTDSTKTEDINEEKAERKKETGYNASNENYKQAKKEETINFSTENGNQAGLNEEKNKTGYALKGENGKKVKQKGGEENRQSNKANAGIRKIKSNTKNKDMQKSGQERKFAPVLRV
jgi:hypothetical protein